MKINRMDVVKGAVAVVLGLVLGGSAWASGAKEVTGEIVDSACYLGHGARGAKHRECAEMCIKKGAPMGLVTEKGEFFLLLPNHDNWEPYDQAKGLAAETVTVKGEEKVKHGVRSIVVDSVEAQGASGKVEPKKGSMEHPVGEPMGGHHMEHAH